MRWWENYTGEEIAIASRRFGGHQWYFMCPHEDRCCSVLWRPPGGKQFRCRQGWGRRVAYTSQFLGRVNRAHRGKAKIKAKLLGDCELDEWDLPPKPKGMRWATYDRYAECLDKYQAVLNEGVEELWAKLAASNLFSDE